MLQWPKLGNTSTMTLYVILYKMQIIFHGVLATYFVCGFQIFLGGFILMFYWFEILSHTKTNNQSTQHKNE